MRSAYLVDDATVEIENIERNLHMGKELKQAILDGAQQIAVPALVSTLCNLYRVRADVLPDRRGAVSVCATGGSGGVRDAGVVSAFANAGADAGHVSDARTMNTMRTEAKDQQTRHVSGGL